MKKRGGENINNDQFRSNMLTLKTLLELMQTNGLSDRHMILLKKTPFWLLIDTYVQGLVTEKLYKKYDANIFKIVKHVDMSRGKFKFGNRFVEFTLQHVAEILGIPNSGIHIDLKKRGVPGGTFISNYFDTKKQCTKTMIEGALIKALKKSGVESERDVARLVVFHLCASFFFPNTGNTLGWSFASYVQDIGKTKEYNWPVIIHEWLLASIRKKLPENNPSTITGCVPLLLFWLCEIADIIPAIKGRETMEPRFLRWELPMLNKLFADIELKSIKLRTIVISVDNVTKVQMRKGKTPILHNVSDEDFDVSLREAKKQAANRAKRPYENEEDVVDLSSPTPEIGTPFRASGTCTRITLSSKKFYPSSSSNISKASSPRELFGDTGYTQENDSLPQMGTCTGEMNELDMKEYYIGGTPIATSEYYNCLKKENEEIEKKIEQHETDYEKLVTLRRSDQLTVISLQNKIEDMRKNMADCRGETCGCNVSFATEKAKLEKI